MQITLTRDSIIGPHDKGQPLNCAKVGDVRDIPDVHAKELIRVGSAVPGKQTITQPK